MPRVEHSVVIGRPIDEVFGYLTDCTRNPTWLSSVLGASWTSPEPHGVGATGRMVVRFLGKRVDLAYEVTDHAPPKSSAIRRVGGPLEVTSAYTFEPVEGGTKVTTVSEGTTNGFFKLADALLAPMFKRELRADFGNLKTLLEARAGSAA